MFTIEMLPARYGDCLWVEYGDPQCPHRILIDGGKAATCKDIIKKAKAVDGDCVFDLLVVTHIDADHIDGILELLRNLPPNIVIQEIWFNGWDQITHRLGAPAGEYLSGAIRQNKLRWNERFGGQAVVVQDPLNLPRINLQDGMILTILSPTPAGLSALVPVWKQECAKAGLIPGSGPQKPARIQKARLGESIDVIALAAQQFDEDTSEANGSSIAFLAECEGKSCVFSGDAHPSVLVESISKGINSRRIDVNAFKLPHHGSKNNLDLDLASLVQARKYLISTNGSIYDHPDSEALARVMKGKASKAELFFNYQNPKKFGIWNDIGLQNRWKYIPHFPSAAAGGIHIDL